MQTAIDKLNVSPIAVRALIFAYLPESILSDGVVFLRLQEGKTVNSRTHSTPGWGRDLNALPLL
jgi:hypothetical protein